MEQAVECQEEEMVSEEEAVVLEEEVFVLYLPILVFVVHAQPLLVFAVRAHIVPFFLVEFVCVFALFFLIVLFLRVLAEQLLLLYAYGALASVVVLG